MGGDFLTKDLSTDFRELTGGRLREGLTPSAVEKFELESLGRQRTFGEAIGGGFQRGAAGVAFGLESAYEGLTGRDPRLSSMGDIYNNLLAEHPTWHPQQINGAWDLITDPQELAGTIAESVPYMATLLAGSVVGTATGMGLVIPFAIATLIEGGQAYSQAIEDGATVEQAEIAGVITGTISGAIELIPLNEVMSLARGGKGSLLGAASRAAKRRLGPTATKALTGGGAWAVARVAALEGLEEVLQGTTGEVTAWGVYDKDIPEGFVSRRLLEFTGGAVAGAFFGLGGLGANKSLLALDKNEDTAKQIVNIAKVEGLTLTQNEAGQVIAHISIDDVKLLENTYGDTIFTVAKDGSTVEISAPRGKVTPKIVTAAVRRMNAELEQMGRRSVGVVKEALESIPDRTEVLQVEAVQGPVLDTPLFEESIEDRSVLAEEEAERAIVSKVEEEPSIFKEDTEPLDFEHPIVNALFEELVKEGGLGDAEKKNAFWERKANDPDPRIAAFAQERLDVESRYQARKQKEIDELEAKLKQEPEKEEVDKVRRDLGVQDLIILKPGHRETPSKQKKLFESAADKLRARPGMNRSQFYKLFYATFFKDYMSTEEFTKSIVPLVEGHAVVWATNTGKSVDEWFHTIKDIEESRAKDDRYAEVDIAGRFDQAVAVLRAFDLKGSFGTAGLHELFHVFEAQMNPNLRQEALEALGHDSWTPQAREDFVDGAIKWFRTGSEANAAKRSIPQILKEAYENFRLWLKKIFPKVKESIALRDAPDSRVLQEIYREAFIPTEKEAQERFEDLGGPDIRRGDVEEGDVTALDLSDLEGEGSSFTISERPEIGFGEKRVQEFVDQLVGDEKAGGATSVTSDEIEASLPDAEGRRKMESKGWDVPTKWEVGMDIAGKLDELGIGYVFEQTKDEQGFTIFTHIDTPTEGMADSENHKDYTSGMPRQVSWAGGVRAWYRGATVRRISEALKQTFDISTPLKIREGGKTFLMILGKIQTKLDVLSGRTTHIARQAYDDLTFGDIKWISSYQAASDYELSNQRLLLDEQEDAKYQVSSPNARITAWRDAMWNVNQILGAEAESIGVLRKDGAWYVPYKQGPVGRLVRSLMPQAREALLGNDVEFKSAILESVKRHNPKLAKVKDLARKLQEWATRGTFAKSHMLEYGRIVPIMPDRVKVDGRWKQVLEVAPDEIIERTIQSQAMRIATIEHLGQRGLGSGLKYAKAITKALGISSGLSNTKEDLRTRLIAKTGMTQEELSELTSKQLWARAKQNNVKIGDQVVDHMNVLLTIDELTESEMKKIQKIARKMRGLGKDFTWDDMKQRMTSDVENIYNKLLQDFKAQGGREGHFNHVLALQQGLSSTPTNTNPLARYFRFMMGMIGSGQVSRAAIPNLPQTALLLPGFTYRGYFKALGSFITDRKAVMERNAEVGAFKPQIMKKMIASGAVLRDVGKIIRQGISRVTLLNWAVTNNNILAAETFRNLALEWKGQKLGPSEISKARRIDLNERDITMLKEGLMDDELFNRIIQNGVAMTQFLNKPMFKRGIVETNPYLRIIFPYLNYANNTLIALFGQAKALGVATKNRDAGTAVIELSRIMSTMTRMALGGMLVNAVRKAIGLRRREPPDETTWDKAMDGLMSTALFGPVNRMADAFDRPIGDIGDLATRLSPKLKALGDFALTTIDEGMKLIGRPGQFGRYAEYGAGTRYAKLVRRNFGALDSAIRAIESKVYPNMTEYNRQMDQRKAFEKSWYSKKISTAPTPQAKSYWQRKQRDSMIFSSRPSDPVRNEIFEAVRDGMNSLAADLVRQYYQESFLAGVQFDKARLSLKSSLRGRAPLNMAEEMRFDFLNTQKEKDKVKHIKAHQSYVNVVDYLTQ